MRLRGLVLERYVTFERAEVDLCDERAQPLDTVLFVGESGTGKTAILRSIAGLLREAASGAEDLGPEDVRAGSASARCRIVFDDHVRGSPVIVKLDKELVAAPNTPSPVFGSPKDAFDRWHDAIEASTDPRAAFSIASLTEEGDDPASAEGVAEDKIVVPGRREPDPLFAWLRALRGRPGWDTAIGALDRVLWPYRVDHLTEHDELVFSSAAGPVTSSDLGDGFESVLVMALELARLSTHRPNEELTYVIDDIDAHLHPRWQARIIDDLRRAFPRVQLIASTHSPLVVGSVEPHQVFRITTPNGEKGASVVRVSDRLQNGGHGSWSVMEYAFGCADLPGPRWVNTPPLAVRRDVLRAVGADLTRGAIVYALPEIVYSRELKNSFGEVALPNAPGASGFVFFIDLAPGATWGHPCEYVFRTSDGRLTRSRAIWPPPNLERYVPIGRG